MAGGHGHEARLTAGFLIHKSGRKPLSFFGNLPMIALICCGVASQSWGFLRSRLGVSEFLLQQLASWPPSLGNKTLHCSAIYSNCDTRTVLGSSSTNMSGRWCRMGSPKCARSINPWMSCWALYEEEQPEMWSPLSSSTIGWGPWFRLQNSGAGFWVPGFWAAGHRSSWGKPE